MAERESSLAKTQELRSRSIIGDGSLQRSEISRTITRETWLLFRRFGSNRKHLSRIAFPVCLGIGSSFVVIYHHTVKATRSSHIAFSARNDRDKLPRENNEI